MSYKKRSGLVESAYNSIKQDIIYNKIAPGEPLSENKLAKQLDMSRTPIRAALTELQRDELVVNISGMGVFVKEPSVKELQDIYSVRRALECLAIETAINNIDDEEINNLKDKWLKIEELINNGAKIDWEQVSEMDNYFHNFIVNKSANSKINNFINQLNMHILRYQLLSAKALASVEKTVQEHIRIMDCMLERDLDKLNNLLKEHIEKSAENVIKHYLNMQY